MISNPRPGQRVRAHYAARSVAGAPYHGRIGTVVVAGRGRPRNHGVRFDGDEHVTVIPAGNLQRSE